ncbi:uncharacterized protein LOC141599706 [Silene latifolia]|uniref:uncharacterized protein LOC141599706 n=1 Tax=Silene latifolia TaxID=37657 RepID=UPI003D770FBB
MNCTLLLATEAIITQTQSPNPPKFNIYTPKFNLILNHSVFLILFRIRICFLNLLNKMSAIVCGKRAYFDELLDYSSSSSSSPIPVSKRIRYASSSSPVRLSLSKNRLFDTLRELFPSMDIQHLEKALDECGGDIDAAIKRLHQLCLGSSEGSASINHIEPQVEQGGAATEGNTLPTDGTQWVELVVSEMMSAASLEDARARAARVLEALEKSIKANTSSEALDKCDQENMMLKEQIQELMRNNTILKRAVQIQHLRQKEFDDKSQEVQQLKQLSSQYQEQMRALEVNNYALSMHLKQAQQSNSIPGRFHPDIF